MPRGLLVQLPCGLLCASGTVITNLSTRRDSDPSSWWKCFTTIWPNVCAAAVLLACLSHFPALWFINLLLEYLPIFKASQRRQPLFKSKHPSQQHGVASWAGPQTPKFLAGEAASFSRWHGAGDAGWRSELVDSSHLSWVCLFPLLFPAWVNPVWSILKQKSCFFILLVCKTSIMSIRLSVKEVPSQACV